MKNFYVKLLKNNLWYLLGILALAGLMFFLYTSMQNSASDIKEKRDSLLIKTSALGSLASLRGDYEKAKPYFSLLENILPPRDQLLTFSQDLEAIAKKNNLSFGFTFGEEKAGTDVQPGHISFRITLEGSYTDTVNFMKALETGRYFIDFNNADTNKKGDLFSSIINGMVFFR